MKIRSAGIRLILTIIILLAIAGSAIVVTGDDSHTDDGMIAPIPMLTPVPLTADITASYTLSAKNAIANGNARADLPLNTCSANIFYDPVDRDWVINKSGEYYLDLSTSNNSGPGVRYNGSHTTFYNFGPDFAILINASNVILNGMGAILNGGGTTQYGIIVNAQVSGNNDDASHGMLTGISITNITLTGFSKGGILFKTVTGTLLPATERSSNITNVNTSDNNPGGGGTGIKLENSRGIELRNNRADRNYDGIRLDQSDTNHLTGNTANGNDDNGFNLSDASLNTLSGNNAGSNHNAGFFLFNATLNTLSGNYADSDHNSGFFLFGSTLNTLSGNYADSNNNSGFFLFGSTLNTLSGNYADYNDNSGFFLFGSTLNALSGNTADANHNSGFFLPFSSLNSLTGNSADFNHNSGFFLPFSSLNSLTGNSASANYIDGFNLTGSGLNTISGNNAFSNGENGVSIQAGFDNILMGNTVSGNKIGIYLDGSGFNYITGNNASGNEIGIDLNGSINNNLSGNNVSGNSDYGINLKQRGSNSNDNLIYNNYFNNTRDALVDSESTGNTWNTIPTPGPNIVHGSWISGNYWATPDKTGWSQTHTDIGNGFTIPYNITDDRPNIDQHPLTLLTPAPPGPAPGPNGEVPSIISPTPVPLPQPYSAVFAGSTLLDSIKAGRNW
jgi:parallel beta-helix repeat protein